MEKWKFLAQNRSFCTSVQRSRPDQRVGRDPKKGLRDPTIGSVATRALGRNQFIFCTGQNLAEYIGRQETTKASSSKQQGERDPAKGKDKVRE
ncbi:hypothetical protein L2E82_22920 [Cichorium intybus]|uniref:Uncharacterized protein n=1 Tax=Cichorium intybus TaxID=13427 RepID=A0ACB9DYQ5_CICIN|nr:hypothetical protein L2E82_22920 [Cichorium intybus]